MTDKWTTPTKMDIQKVETYLMPEPNPTNFQQGFNERQLERQSVKGLTPKYCFAGLNSNQTVNNGVNAMIGFTMYDTNDQRMNATPTGRIIIPGKGLYSVECICRNTGSITGQRTVTLYRNGTSQITMGTGFFEVIDSKNQDGGSILKFTSLLFLNQADYLEVNFNNASGSNITLAGLGLTQFRIISYILL